MVLLAKPENRDGQSNFGLAFIDLLIIVITVS